MAKQKVLECGQTEVKLTCVKCKKVTSITANNPEIYTEEIRNNYVCLHCKSGSKLKLKTISEPKKQPEKEAVKPLANSTKVKKSNSSSIIKEAESIVKETPCAKQPISLTEEQQNIINDIVTEIMDDLEKLGAYTNLKEAISNAVKIELTKKLPKETLKEAIVFSKTLYFIK